MAHDGRHLVAQRFAAARGHQHQRVAAATNVLDDGRLLAAEVVVAEDLAQHGARSGTVVGGRAQTVVLSGVHGAHPWA